MIPNPMQADVSHELVNAQIMARALSEKLLVAERDLKSLQGALKVKGEQVIRLEAENVRLKLVRTDEQLSLEVEGLRRAAGTRDRTLVELQRSIDQLKESEALALRRAAEAERKSAAFEGTLRTMQTARDSAQSAVAQAEQRVADALSEAAAAVRRSVDADERAKKATEPFVKLLVLAEAIVKKSPSLNRNETEVKNFRDALEKSRKA